MKFSFSLITLVYALSAPILAAWIKRDDCEMESKKPWPPNRTNTTQRLIWLRNEINRPHAVRGPILDAFIVSSYDEHQGEFVAERDKRLKYISGFSGPVGLAVITKTKAAFWTDSDYSEQAERELDCNWILLRLGEPGEPSPTEWLKSELKPGYRVGANPKLIPFEMWEAWNKDLSTGRIALVETYSDLIDVTWTIGRPPYGIHSAFVSSPEHSGYSWQNKVRRLREELDRFGCDAAIVTALEEISWLLNVRGKDVPYNPFVRSYLIVTKSELHWYVPEKKVGETVRKQLAMDAYGEYSVRSHPYSGFLSGVRTFSQSWKKVLIPSSCTFSPGASQAVVSAVPPDKRLLRPSPVIFMKAKKNRAELEGMQNANRRDSAALVDFLSILEEQIRDGNAVTEANVTRDLESHRLNESLMSQSIPYPTVAAFGENGALFRYESSDATDLQVDGSSLLVLRGGCHYDDGTSDVTRTFHFGTPSKEMKNDYTRLLSGLIKFSWATFPRSVKSAEVDVILRSELWKYGMEYRHDTCHGIGAFSTAKESPILINYKNPSSHERSLEESYLVTCAPGFYKLGKYGVRLGNVMKVISKGPIQNEAASTYLGFEQITLFPFELKLIDFEKLSKQEIEWLNEYHRRVQTEIGAELEKRSKLKALDWLKQKTKPAPFHYCRSSASGLGLSAFTYATVFGSCFVFFRLKLFSFSSYSF